MSFTLTTADAALKEFYLPGAREQLNNENTLLALIQKNTKDIEGRRAILSPHLARSGGIGARPDNGTLPTAGNQGYGEERVPVLKNYGRIQVSGPTIAAMRSDRGSFVRAVDSEMQGITADLRRDLNRQVWGNGDGKIATTTVSSNTVTIGLATATSTVQLRQLADVTSVYIGTAASVTAASLAAVSVSAVDEANKTITVGTAITTATTHFVFRAGNVDDNLVHEVTGLQKIVDSTGAVHNLNPATAGQAAWKSVELSNSGTNRSITENLMAQAVQQIRIAGGKYPTHGFASDGVFRAYGNLLTSLKRSPNTTQLKGGYTALDFSAGGPTVPVSWDRDCPANSLYFINVDHLIDFRMNDWDWMDKDGAVLSRVANADAYEATLFLYNELATDKRNAHGKILDLTEA